MPSQVEPASAVVHGTGERIDPVALAPMGLVLLTDPGGLSTGAVYAELDRLRAEGEAPAAAGLDPGPLKRLAGSTPSQLATRLENDLQLAALWLRPDLGARLDALRAAGAHGVLVSGSGPTVFGVFDDRAAAEAAAAGIPGALAARGGGVKHVREHKVLAGGGRAGGGRRRALPDRRDPAPARREEADRGRGHHARARGPTCWSG